MRAGGRTLPVAKSGLKQGRRWNAGREGTPVLKLATTPLGPGLLVAVALGLVIFGIYCGCEARWRNVQPG
jgi:hypothetical protein